MRAKLIRAWPAPALASLVLAALAITATAEPNVTWKAGPPAPFAYTRFDGETVGESDIPGFGPTRAFFLGGRLEDDTTEGTIWSFDGQAYEQTGAVMPVPVSNYGIAKLTDGEGKVRLYIFGGRVNNGEHIRTVQSYDPVTNTASTLPEEDNFPGVTVQGCITLPAMGVAVVQNRAVVMGGIGIYPYCEVDVSEQTWIFDVTARSGRRWKRGPNLTMARGYITPAVVGPKVYAIGGDIVVGMPGHLGLKAVARVEVMNPLAPPATRKWRRRADLPQPCDESQAFGFRRGPLQGRIVLAGCGQWRSALPNSYIFDTAMNTWTETDPLLEARRNHAGFLSPLSTRTMFVLGGYAADGQTVLQTSETSRAKPDAGASGGGSRLRSGRFSDWKQGSSTITLH